MKLILYHSANSGEPRQISCRPMSITTWPDTPSGAAMRVSSSGSGQHILHDGKRNVGIGLGAKREIAHWFAVPHQQNINHMVGGISGAKIDQLRPLAFRHSIIQRIVQRQREPSVRSPQKQTRPAKVSVSSTSFYPFLFSPQRTQRDTEKGRKFRGFIRRVRRKRRRENLRYRFSVSFCILICVFCVFCG